MFKQAPIDRTYTMQEVNMQPFARQKQIEPTEEHVDKDDKPVLFDEDVDPIICLQVKMEVCKTILITQNDHFPSGVMEGLGINDENIL